MRKRLAIKRKRKESLGSPESSEVVDAMPEKKSRVEATNILSLVLDDTPEPGPTTPHYKNPPRLALESRIAPEKEARKSKDPHKPGRSRSTEWSETPRKLPAHPPLQVSAPTMTETGRAQPELRPAGGGVRLPTPHIKLSANPPPRREGTKRKVEVLDLTEDTEPRRAPRQVQKARPRDEHQSW